MNKLNRLYERVMKEGFKEGDVLILKKTLDVSFPVNNVKGITLKAGQKVEIEVCDYVNCDIFYGKKLDRSGQVAKDDLKYATD